MSLLPSYEPLKLSSKKRGCGCISGCHGWGDWVISPRPKTGSACAPQVTAVGDLLGPSLNGLERLLQIPTGGTSRSDR